MFKDVDVGEDGTAVGRLLRIKVLIDIRKPLMRGITVKVGNPEKEKWCSFAYEYLPDFCYTCGLIGHTDKQCSIWRESGETQQFSRSLRFIPEKRRGEGSEERRSSSKSRGPWISGSSGSRGSYDYRSDRWGSSKSGSGALVWRKSGEDKSTEKGEEVTSPEKIIKVVGKEEDRDSVAKKALLPQLEAPAFSVLEKGGGAEKNSEEDGKKNEKRGTFKRYDKNRTAKGDGGKKGVTEKKRRMDIDGEEQVEGAKKMKAGESVEKNQTSVEKNAGPADQSCGTQ